MSDAEFYSMYEKKRVSVDPSKITVKEIKRTSEKTGKVSVRYQAVGEDGQGRKVYKFISADLAGRLRG